MNPCFTNLDRGLRTSKLIDPTHIAHIHGSHMVDISLSIVNIPSKTPLEKTIFSFVSRWKNHKRQVNSKGLRRGTIFQGREIEYSYIGTDAGEAVGQSLEGQGL